MPPSDPSTSTPGTQVDSRIGVDEWVASFDERRDVGAGVVGWARKTLARVPGPFFYLLFGVVAGLVPVVTDDAYVVRVGFDTLLYMLLALGLNVVVGYAGLLDLGYVAFYGFGAYGYAMLASPKFGLHWNALAILPVVVAATTLLGFLVALPSRRLVGDYLAVLTLFFGQLFVSIYTNGEHISALGFTHAYDVTGGPNGIPNIDNFDIFGLTIGSVTGYFYAALTIFLVVLAAAYLAEHSRTGRAWKALRDDSLAAELMGIPVRRLKLVAFACGAGIAGLAGTLFAGLNSAVFAPDFDLPTQIIVYAMLILGGAGSLGGVIVGAVVVNVSLEVLRTPSHASWIFYLLVATSLLVKVRPWRRLAIVAAATIGFGFAVHAIVAAAWPRGTAGDPTVGGPLGAGVADWVVLPSNPRVIGNIAFVGLVLAVLALTTLRPLWRTAAIVPTLYLAAFVWENRLAAEPSVTRLILIGVILIVLMNVRPRGLLGADRVELI